jgi:hypothetical protein
VTEDGDEAAVGGPRALGTEGARQQGTAVDRARGAVAVDRVDAPVKHVDNDLIRPRLGQINLGHLQRQAVAD